MEALGCKRLSLQGALVSSQNQSQSSNLCMHPGFGSCCQFDGDRLLSRLSRHTSSDWSRIGRRRLRRSGVARAAADSPYEILGVPKSATEKDIKKAYRKLALKYHPDVNKQADAQATFVRIKQAYLTLSDAASRTKYDRAGTASSGSRGKDFDPFSWGSKGETETQEEFYGIGEVLDSVRQSLDEFFKDLQKDVEGRRERSKGAPKSLWEELSEIGGEFVDFLESSLPEEGGRNVQNEGRSSSKEKAQSSAESNSGRESQEETRIPKRSLDDEIDDMLSTLKKEIGKS